MLCFVFCVKTDFWHSCTWELEARRAWSYNCGNLTLWEKNWSLMLWKVKNAYQGMDISQKVHTAWILHKHPCVSKMYCLFILAYWQKCCTFFLCLYSSQIRQQTGWNLFTACSAVSTQRPFSSTRRLPRPTESSKISAGYKHLFCLCYGCRTELTFQRNPKQITKYFVESTIKRSMYVPFLFFDSWLFKVCMLGFSLFEWWFSLWTEPILFDSFIWVGLEIEINWANVSVVYETCVCPRLIYFVLLHDFDCTW